MCAFQGKASSEAKIAVSNRVAEFIGWKTLKHDTWHSERKFNIWYFFDKRHQDREVKLKHPLPENQKTR